MTRRQYRAAPAKYGEGSYVLVETRPGWSGWDVVGNFRDRYEAEEALEAVNNALERFIEDNGLEVPKLPT